MSNEREFEIETVALGRRLAKVAKHMARYQLTREEVMIQCRQVEDTLNDMIALVKKK